jgi:hypothetical protein
MERNVFSLIRRTLRSIGQRRASRRYTYSDASVFAVYLWAALCDRPVCWACRAENWPRGLRRGPLPDASTVSRRMRRPSIRRLRCRLEHALSRDEKWSLIIALDGKPLPIGPNSHDRQAGFGRSSGTMAKGYKLHMAATRHGAVLDWRLSPMQGDEREMGRRILRDLRHEGYVLADTNYDSTKLHELTTSMGGQLVATRRKRGSGLGHRRHAPGRLRAIEMMENRENRFGWELLHERNAVERSFGTLACTSGCLTHLPPWVRTYRRVENWVGAKLIIYAARRKLRAT